MLAYLLVFVTFIWLLAVFKVFILDDGVTSGPPPVRPSLTASSKLQRSQKHSHEKAAKESKSVKQSAWSGKIVQFTRSEPQHAKPPAPAAAAGSKRMAKLPSSADWLAMYTEGKAASVFSAAAAPAAAVSSSNGNGSGLSWPPVLADGSIPPADGYDTMPLTGLKVPRFWAPPANQDVFTIGSSVGGQETIFLMIASYRDFQCRETITSAFTRADHPERLFVAAVDQVVAGDTGCLDIDIPCSQDPRQAICRYRDQIAVYRMDAQQATGPVTARHIGDRMYRGQHFVMQLDAHCQFVRHWDTAIVQQWRSTSNEMAVLSSYLTDVQGSFTPDGDSTRNTRPIMCNSDFEGAMPARYLRHGSQPEDIPAIRDMPQLSPFWAAGFSFSRGHFKVLVPYDGYQPMVFQGEEIAIGIRGFTFGYDFYAPRDSVVFHEYADNSARRKKIHMFWENGGHAGEGQKSLRRATSVIGMAPDVDPSTWDHSEIDRYGLGKVRDLALFYKLFLIDPVQRHAVQLCPFVNSGIMHRDFQPHLRPDHRGIDYSGLVNYDTYSKLDAQFARQQPFVEKMLTKAIAAQDMAALQEHITAAEKVQLGRKNPDLLAQAKQLLSDLRNDGGKKRRPGRRNNN